MPRTDKSVSFLTGMIIAALYVVLLVSFSRESYVMRGGNPAVASAVAACAEPSTQACAIERSICTPVSGATQEPICVISIGTLRQLIGNSLRSPVSEELEAAEASGDSE
jgi:hypothetical protein